MRVVKVLLYIKILCYIHLTLALNLDQTARVTDTHASASRLMARIRIMSRDDSVTEILPNHQPYHYERTADGWFVKIKVADKTEFDQLMDEAAYKKFVAGLS